MRAYHRLNHRFRNSNLIDYVPNAQSKWTLDFIHKLYRVNTICGIFFSILWVVRTMSLAHNNMRQTESHATTPLHVYISESIHFNESIEWFVPIRWHGVGQHVRHTRHAEWWFVGRKWDGWKVNDADPNASNRLCEVCLCVSQCACLRCSLHSIHG